MQKNIRFLFIVFFSLFFGFGSFSQNKKVIFTYNGNGKIGNSSISISLHLFSSGVIAGSYSINDSKINRKIKLKGKPSLTNKEQATLFASSNGKELGYLIIPYHLRDMEIIRGKWYNINGTKTKNVYIKRNK